KVPLYADAVTVSGEALRQRALWAGVKPENLFVIKTGADVDFIKPLDIYEAREKLGLPLKNVIYSHVGFIDMESLKLLMLAHRQVVKHYSNALLMFVGLGKSQAEFVKSLDMTGNILFVEWQPYHKYPLYLGASDILLLPMQDNFFSRTRPLALRLGDYIAAGRPIITTELPEIAKALSECALLAKPNPKDFASKILAIIRNLDLRKELGKRARELAETDFSWKIRAKTLERIYHQYL
ncbi:MAG: glycosyltransferase, partial [Candidatus Bathyarchaeota archaeon]|nr:glycosyltransferase [Candidatus Bathyarchaeota archaeon]